MREHRGTQAPTLDGDLDDLDSFQACREEIRTYMSQVNPSLYEVLGEIVSSTQPIGEGDILRASQRIMKEKHRALRVFQANVTLTNFTEEKAPQRTSAECQPTEADKLHTRQAERQLGCLLVMKTKGETQLQVCRWLSTANSWEAWRQLNLQYTGKWRNHFELLAKIPAFCLQQINVWKEQVVRYQEFSGEQLPDFIKLSAVLNGLHSSVRNFVLLNLDSDCSFEDLDNLLASYYLTCKDKQRETSKGKGQESNPNFKQQLGEGGQRQDEKRKGEAYPPQPPAYEGKGKPDQLPKRKEWCRICWKKEHRTQAWWWKISLVPSKQEAA